MKIAVFHSFMDNIGGAEKVSLIFAREFDADLYTTNIDKEKIIKMGFKDVLPRIKSIGKVPINAPFRQQLTLWKFRKLNLKGKYDHFIISGDWAMSAVVNNFPNSWYVHSPLNEIWHWKNIVRNEILSFWQKPIFDIWVWINQRLTKNYARHVNNWICNSQNTKNRIKKYYKQDAKIIHPPIYTNEYNFSEPKNYWLSVNRITKNKRIDMQIEAFRKLPNQNLIIVGSYEKKSRQFEIYKKEIENNLPSNVKILNWVSDQELKKLYSECIGFITTSRDEDFGMNVVEAMASGKPVIAPNEGGYKESIVDSGNGILIDDIDFEKIIDAMKKIGSDSEIYKNKNIQQAKLFDTGIFIKKIKRSIEM